MRGNNKGLIPGAAVMVALFVLQVISVPAFAGKNTRLTQPQVFEKKGYNAKKTIKQTRQRLRAQRYRQLIAPNNQCTRLVRRVCGQNNQCSNSPGCGPAKKLLGRYNQRSGDERQQTANSCLAGLEDRYIFPQCAGG